MISEPARSAIEADDVAVSPMAVLELQYLYEIGRLKVGADVITAQLRDDIGLTIPHDSFASVVAASLKENWTRDPFDRIIVGHARFANAPLVSKDERIQEHYSASIW